ncbi:MAG: threonine aldolase family protein [Planctomycetes bacterium]|nr:threonine aldolase family protein [Planctomycetota bacterium]
MELIDLRSDTVTKPSPAMLEAMVRAELGDDDREGDPTVRRLQDLAASKLGKEAALYVPSGTMGNLLAYMTQCTYGAEVIVGDRSHTFTSECTNAASVHGVSMLQIPTTGPFLDPARVEAAIRPALRVCPRTEMVWVENTQVNYMGRVTPLANLAAIQEVARRHRLVVHMDGARIFNAAVALGVDAARIAQYADSVMFCVSKGLAAPVGSLLAGSKDFIERATWQCKKIGGRMRQAGVIAAAGVVALEKMIDRLQEDHDNARFLASRLADLPCLEFDPAHVETNIIQARLRHRRYNQAQAIQALHERGLWVLRSAADGLRFVTHYGIERRHCQQAAAICREVLA